MKFIADLHIHSHFSLATSKQLIPEYLDYWARQKGIKVVGTGDFTHPGWTKELREKLTPAEEGLFKLKPEFQPDETKQLSQPFRDETRFLLTAEISNIYKKNGKVRKIHNVVFAPDIETAEAIQKQLQRFDFNITSDGRPILGMDARDLLDLCLSVSPDIFFVPAHIWTPWFSALGSKSGFNSIEECFGDLSAHISAVETGLSSDPPMNWICSFLDKYTLLSNSDAHSPEKLGRNANWFDTELSYSSIIETIKKGSPDSFPGTIDMFPQEGKYHFDGHRKCGIRWNPLETLQHRGICPVCGKKVTVGVMNRVVELSDRKSPTERQNRTSFFYVIPLKEILSEIHGVGPNSKKIQKAYHQLLVKYGSEMSILLEKPVEDFKNTDDELIGEAIQRMRQKEVYISEGFDGEYGRIKVFAPNESKHFKNAKIFDASLSKEKPPKRELIPFDLAKFRELQNDSNTLTQTAEKDISTLLNPEQKKAIEFVDGSALVIAGPGTGKTRVLTMRIASLIENKHAAPDQILAVTFTNKAAGEMKSRLAKQLDTETAKQITITTFHAFGYAVIKQQLSENSDDFQFAIIDDADKQFILSEEFALKKREIKTYIEKIAQIKQQLQKEDEIDDNETAQLFKKYQDYLKKHHLIDLEDLLYRTVMLLQNDDIAGEYRKKFKYVLVDEYQDVNYAQYKLLRQITNKEKPNIFAIGDPNQAIYGFRGADIKYIRQFVEDFSQAEVFSLTQSYRCTEQIIQASNGIIGNRETEEKMLKGLQEGVKIKISRHQSDRSEAEFIARTIENMMGGLRFFSMDSRISQGNEDAEIQSLSDFVVLCRTRQQTEAIEKAFNDHSIPYQIVGNTPFFKQQPVSLLIDALRSIHKAENDFLNIKIRKNRTKLSLSEEHKTEISEARSVKQKTELICRALDKKISEKNKPDIEKLLQIADSFGNDVESFLKYAALSGGTDTYKPQIENVTLMTLHASKGLEFECVFIAGCEEGLLPYSLFKNEEEIDVEEERRLLYVGMTRAKKYLFISHSLRRHIRGVEYKMPPSPFLTHIEKELIEWQKNQYKPKTKQEDTQMSLF